MEAVIEIGNYQVSPLWHEREVNFTVCRGNNYLFRLVPGYSGFELSKLDKALAATIDNKEVEIVGEQLDRYYS